MGEAGPRRTEDLCERLGEHRYRIDGRDLTVPVSIPDCAMMAQVFAVPIRAARKLLAPASLSPVALWPGSAALVLGGVRYRDSPLGSYDEAYVSVAAYAPGDRALPVFGGLDTLLGRAAQYVLAMPVDQEFTCHAGRFLWGYPKFLANIDIELGEPVASTDLCVEGDRVFSIRVPWGGRVDANVDNPTLTFRGGVLRRVPMRVEVRGAVMRPGGRVPEVGDQGDLADMLRALGLPKRPLMSLSAQGAGLVIDEATPLSTVVD